MINADNKIVKKQISLLEFEEMLVSNDYNPFEHFFNTVVKTASGGIWSQVDSKTDEGVRGELAQEDTTVLVIVMYEYVVDCLTYDEYGQPEQLPVKIDELFARERPVPDLADEFFDIDYRETVRAASVYEEVG